MGPLFRNWVRGGTLGFDIVSVDDYNSRLDNVIIDGSDAQLRDFANQNLGYKRDKGIDFIAKRKGKFVIGEDKFISDEGGHKNDQFLDAMTTLEEKTHKNVTCVAILDGVLYIPSRKKMYTKITSGNIPVMSALLLRDYLYSL